MESNGVIPIVPVSGHVHSLADKLKGFCAELSEADQAALARMVLDGGDAIDAVGSANAVSPILSEAEDRLIHELMSGQGTR